MRTLDKAVEFDIYREKGWLEQLSALVKNVAPPQEEETYECPMLDTVAMLRES